MITFKTDTELTIVTEFDEATDNIIGEEKDIFKAGELVDADILATEILPDGKVSEFVDLQFGDGSMAFGVQRASFDVL